MMAKRYEYRPSKGHKAKKIRHGKSEDITEIPHTFGSITDSFGNIRLDGDKSELEDLANIPLIFGSIIDYLGKKDILALTETSKTLNLFIANSSKALKKFIMKFPRIEALKDGNYDFQVIRKYSNWELSYGIRDKDLKIAAKFLKRYREHIKTFSIYNNYSESKDDFDDDLDDDLYGDSEENVSRQMLQKLLPVCKNINKLTIIDMKMDFADGSGDISALDLPNLRDLILSNGGMLPLFTNCHLKTLEIKNNDHPIINDFLMKQNDIEALSIGNAARIFDTDQLTKVNFKLKRFKIGCTLADARTLPFFKMFLNLHRDTLTELSLSCNHWNDKIFEGVANRIQKLTVIGFEIRVPNLGISVMTKITILKDIAKNFENVTEVHFNNFAIDHDFLAPLPNVKKLLLNNCRLYSALNCSNLTYLHLKIMNYIKNPFTWNANNLKVFIINMCNPIYFLQEGLPNCSFIEDFLERDDTNLNRLELIGKAFMPKENPKLHEIINANRHKIRDFSITQA